jgi:hypothetical protein
VFQGDWDVVEYPHCKGSKPRNPIKYISSYKMEELADLLWIGGIAAKHATDEFRHAWGHLRDAAEHYLYGFDALRQQQREAANSLFQYGECIEKQVLKGKVRNELHAAVISYAAVDKKGHSVSIHSVCVWAFL